MNATHRLVLGDILRRPGLPAVTVVTDHLELEPGRMVEHDVRLAETLLDPVVPDMMAVEVLDPEIHRACWHTVDHTFNLAGAAASLPADLPVGKGGADRPGDRK